MSEFPIENPYLPANHQDAGREYPELQVLDPEPPEILTLRARRAGLNTILVTKLKKKDLKNGIQKKQ